jgi:DNA-binding transcriptional LysR family regulator
MELSQLRCFVAVAEELHFGRAAKRLFMTQPPLSRQIQLLEHDLGVELLERSSRQVHLSAAGHSFLRDARQILAFAQQASTSAQRVARGEAGRLTLGFTAVSAYSMIPQLLAQAQHALPNVDLVLREMVSVAQVEALASRMIDIGFIRQVATRHALEYQLIQKEPLLVAMPPSHALAQKKKIDVSDLDQQPFIMYTPTEGRYFYDCIAGLFAAHGVTPEYVQHVGQTHTILGLVRAGLGLTIVPASAQELHFTGLEFRPLRQPGYYAEIYLAWRTDNDNPALPALRNMISAHFANPASDAR